MQQTEIQQTEIEMFYDGDCPLCLRETRLLRKLDRRGRIQFTNIADPAFEPTRYGRTMDELMAEMALKVFVTTILADDKLLLHPTADESEPWFVHLLLERFPGLMGFAPAPVLSLQEYRQWQLG